MENQEPNNIQQEVIDILAKKMTEFEKRQSKIEELGIAHLPSKMEELERKLNENADMKAFENIKQLEKFSAQLNRFDAKLDAMPNSIPLKHEFEPRSRFVIKILLGLILGICVLLTITINLYSENNRKSEVSNKFFVISGLYPDVARKIDSAYSTNSDSLLKEAQAKIDEREAISQAAIDARQAAEESKAAHDKLRILKGRVNKGKHQK